MEQPGSEMELASELRTVVSRLMKKMRGKSGATQMLSMTERSVMKLLDEHKEMLPSELAAAEKVTNQSMSQILNHLAELNFINRTPSETDKRKVIVSLSRNGIDVIRKARADRDEWLRKALAETWTAKERDMLRKLIEPLTRLVDIE